MHDAILPSDAAYDNGAPVRRAKRRQGGLTLIELIVTIAVLAIVATVGIPGFQQFSARNEVAAEVMRIKTALALARNTAVTRRTTIAICPVASAAATNCDFEDWGKDLVIVTGQTAGKELVDTTLLKILEGDIGPKVTFNRTYPIRYKQMGRSKGHNGTFEICGRKEEGATIIVSNSGRVRVEPKDSGC
ncbi:GspH/FimT family pseudopilin [Halomonas korlensis]|uniref:Type II secretion system protein H n=1 Tax=Halomonas korlensis TaxID=463301 RepID=A0A1I7K1R2_9GAMM|nr:GspH/FimT family pseudopilin [Halomonas korlensis]SFU91351.1 type IV fimbrial biogenesis protein FimT [Halomonas korlensis]